MLGKGLNFQGHRLAWLYVHGVDPPEQVDHINGVRHDNRLANLRLATNGENCRNANIQRNNRSGFRGVWFENQRGLWEARIHKDGRRAWRGFFKTAEEANKARLAVLEEHHGEFAKLDAKPREYVHSRHRYGDR